MCDHPHLKTALKIKSMKAISDTEKHIATPEFHFNKPSLTVGHIPWEGVRAHFVEMLTQLEQGRVHIPRSLQHTHVLICYTHTTHTYHNACKTHMS